MKHRKKWQKKMHHQGVHSFSQHDKIPRFQLGACIPDSSSVTSPDHDHIEQSSLI
jgi:hypothetical protein